MRIIVPMMAIAVFLSACAKEKVALPPAPASAFPQTSQTVLPDYRIGALDELSVTVFREADLSVQVPVDASGNVALPLAGKIRAENLTTTELANEVAQRLDRYIVNPRVTINVTRPTSLRATVDGRVNKPGIYDIDGHTTLLQVVARAEGETDTADLHDVVIFRRIDQQVFAARFDISAIRKSEQEDPRLRSGDTVVVGASSLKGLYQDFLKAAPFLGTVFIALRN